MKLKTFFISLASVIVQYYDYQMLGLAAPLISKYFFPMLSPAEGLFNTFLLITLSYTAKPLGAIILGKIGDVYGRSTTINVSLFGTAIASFMISLIPTYSSIGFAAILLLFLFRMLISAFVSSGTDGIRIFVYEKIGSKNQCLGIGLVTSATMIGVLLSSISLTYCADLDSAYSWRIPFLIGAISGIIVLISRLFIDKNIGNYIAKEQKYLEYRDVKLRRLIHNNLKLFILCLILAGTIGSINQFYIIFLGSYNSSILGLISFEEMSSYRSLAIFAYIIAGIISGLLADSIGKLKTNFAAIISLIFISINMILNINYGIFRVELYILGAFFLPFVIVPPMVILKGAVPPVIRYRIFSLAHAIGSIFISGTTNSIASYLYKATNIVWLPMIFFIFILFLMLIVISLLHKTTQS